MTMLLFAFSNCIVEDIKPLLENTTIKYYFKDIVSTDEIKSFKPNPAVFCPFAETLKGISKSGLANIR